MAALPRSCKLLCSGREEASRLKEAQVRHRFVVPHRRVWMWKNGSVEERLFRAASACAFDCGLQPRPALKGIHPPAVAAMNGRSSTLTQAFVLRARRNTRQEETQVRHRFVVPTLVSPTPGETKKWGSLSLFRFRKRWASPPPRNTQVPDNPLYPCHSEGAFRP